MTYKQNDGKHHGSKNKLGKILGERNKEPFLKIQVIHGLIMDQVAYNPIIRREHVGCGALEPVFD